MFRIIDCEQGSPEWYDARLGKWTASFFDKAVTNTGKMSAQATEVNNRLVAELIVGQPDETFQSDAMLRGKELEGEALGFLNFTHGLDFKPVGFLDTEMGFGCSPDALDQENEIGLELKCPLPHNHLAYLAGGVLPKKYFAQVQGSMMVTGYKKWLFCSYHPLLKPLVVEVERDNAYIEKLEEAIKTNCKLVKEMHEHLAKELEGWQA